MLLKLNVESQRKEVSKLLEVFVFSSRKIPGRFSKNLPAGYLLVKRVPLRSLWRGISHMMGSEFVEN